MAPSCQSMPPPGCERGSEAVRKKGGDAASYAGGSRTRGFGLGGASELEENREHLGHLRVLDAAVEVSR